MACIFHKIGWVSVVLKIPNVEGHQHFMISSKVTMILMMLKMQKSVQMEGFHSIGATICTHRES